MKLSVSLALDGLRLAAALLVVAGHLSYTHLVGPKYLIAFDPLGADAVVFFFVLSGFVIAHVMSRKELDGPAYFSARAARMLSVAWPALLVTLVADSIGRGVNPGFYSNAWWYKDTHPALRLLMNAFFMGQSWVKEVRPFSNGPYWSLAYEVWFYLIWGLFAFSKRHRYLLALGACVMAGPRIVLLFPLWLAGYGLYRLLPKVRTRLTTDILLLVGSAALYVLYRKSGYAGHLGEKLLPAVLLRHPDWLGRSATFIDSYVVAAITLMGFAGTYLSLSRVTMPEGRPFASVVRELSSYTFAIYAVHYPVAHCAAAILGERATGAERAFVILTSMAVVCIGVAKLGDRLKAGLAQEILAWSQLRGRRARVITIRLPNRAKVASGSHARAVDDGEDFRP
jgi:peptidoglycan/LPS O-acetylase OafA/YrhL